MRNAVVPSALLLLAVWKSVAGGAEPVVPAPQRIAAASHVVIDANPGRVVLRRDAYTLVYDPDCRIPAWGAYQANQRTWRSDASALVPTQVIPDPQVAVAPSPAEVLEELPKQGFRMIQLVPSSWLGGTHPRQMKEVPTQAQADLTSNLIPVDRGSAESPDGLWTGLQRWLEELVMLHDMQLSVIAGCIVDPDESPRTGPREDICVPSRFFAVVARGGLEGGPVQAIAFLFPRQPEPLGAIGNYLTPIEVIEGLSGLRLFAERDDEPALPWQPWYGPAPPTRPVAPDMLMLDAVPYSVREEPEFLLVPSETVRTPRDTPAPPMLDMPPAPSVPAPDMAKPADDEILDEEASPEDRLVRVFYGTDRARTGSRLANDHYGSESNGELALGICDVSIPPTHIQGSGMLERPWPFLPEDPERHVMLLEVHELPSTKFVEQFQNAVIRSAQDATAGKRPAFVFIHGYNNSFADAARRTAQMAFDLNLDIVPAMYSWPSRGNWWEYRRDRNQFEKSVPQLSEFLSLITEQCEVDKLHIICHSMGSELFQMTLDQLMRSAHRAQIDQIILAAPDIDAEIFCEKIAPRIGQAGQRVTIYVSARDRALLASQYANLVLAPRLGLRAWDALYGFKNIHQVDATSVDTSVTGHLYYGSNSSILGDIREVLNGAQPQQRRLIQVGQHYAFPLSSQDLPTHDPPPGWDRFAFRQEWQVFLDPKVLLVTGLLLLTLAVMLRRIRRLKRALAPHSG